MKNQRFISKIVVMAVCLALALTFVFTDTANAAPKGYGFTYKGVTVYMDSKADKLLKKPENQKRKQSPKAAPMTGWTARIPIRIW